MTVIRPIRTHRTRGALALLVLLAVAIPAIALFALAPTAAAAQQSVTVPIANFAFSPADLTVHTGDTVTWVNQDRAPHNVTSTNGPASFASTTLKQGQSFSYTFTVPGSYSYQCTIHPDMVAAITVLEHETAPAAAPPPAETAPEQPADAAPADDAPAADAPADGAAQAAPEVPPADASAAPAPAVLPPSAPQATQVVGAAQQGRQLDPLLIVAGVALGVTTLCLLLISGQPTTVLAPASSGSALGAAGAGGQGPATAMMAAPQPIAGSRHRNRELVSPFLLRVAAALGLAVDGYVHFNLAADYDTVGDLITQGMLFRLQGAVAVLAALLILLVRRNLVYQAVFLVAISALFPVVLYTYVDVGAIGPLPNMYEPAWYLDKTISAIAEAVAAVAAGMLGVRPLLQRRSAPRHGS